MLAARGLVVAPAGRAAHERVACGPLDLDVAPGGWLTLRGGNGAGKSTLLATLAGLLPPAAGTLRLGGHDPFSSAGRRVARATVGVVFQEPETQALTDAVAREIAFPLENLGWARAAIDARVDELLADFGLGDVRAAPPAHLSGGEAQKLALAAALAPRPALLLLDEPDSYLDPGGRAALLDALATLRARHGTAVVWSTCDPADPGPAGAPALDLGAGLPYGVSSPASDRPAAPAPPIAGAGDGAPLLWTGEGLVLERADARGPIELWGGLGFAIGRGERVVLLGDNGSGKTALLDALAGLTEPGRRGSLATDIPSGGLGYLTQFPESQLFAETVRDDVAFSLRHRKGARGTTPSEVARRTDRAIAQAGLDPARVGDRAPDALSLGERRRVALAGILAGEPSAVLLDEPTAGLDPAGRRDLEAVLEAAGRAGVTLVVATHDPAWGNRPGWSEIRLPGPRRLGPGAGRRP